MFMSTRAPNAQDDEREIFYSEQQPLVVDGVLGLHVDDYVGCGEHVITEKT